MTDIMTVKLAINGLTKRFGDLEVLREINVAITRGEFISLVGPSGCVRAGARWIDLHLCHWQPDEQSGRCRLNSGGDR